LNLPLDVGGVADTVEVLAASDEVSTSTAQLGVGFDQTKIIGLPLDARNIVGLLGLQSGVTLSAKANEYARDDGGQVNGARNDQQNITLDGVNINSQEKGSALTGALPTTLDSIQEFIVQTAGQGGGAGRSSGAQVQLVTKSGSNEWHGSMYEYYRTTGTSAKNYFASEATPLIRHLPGGSIGGPLMKGKLFIFGAYEARTDRSATLESRNVPTTEFLNGDIRYLRTDGTFGVLTDGPGGILERWTGVPGDNWNTAVIGPSGLYEPYRPFSSDAGRTRPGGDNGANTLVYRFNAPFKRNQNVYISRIDYNLSPRNTLFVRGTMNDDVRTHTAETFPGFNNARELLDNSKGFAANWNFVITPTLNSNTTVGLTRESFELTGNNEIYYAPPLFTALVQTGGAERQLLNTWNIVENLSWSKGRHNVQLGGNVRFISNYLNSFDAVQSPRYGASAATTTGLVGQSSPGLRAAIGDEEFNRIRDKLTLANAALAATGSTQTFREDVQFDLSGKPLPAGSPFVRTFKMQEYDFHVQDAWQLTQSVTLNYGVQYGVQTPPYEADGYQVNWTQHLGQRYREQMDSNRDVMSLPYFEVQLAGRKNGLPDYYSPDINNWAPRVSLAWNPTYDGGILGALTKGGGALSIRTGYALTYDRIGGRFARDASVLGSIGLKTLNSPPGNQWSFDGTGGLPKAPRIHPDGSFPRDRFTSITEPSYVVPFSGGSYGVSNGIGSTSGSGIDSGMHNPTNHLLNFTLTKELPGNFVVEASYVGRFARGLLGQVDLGTPVNLRDPISGTTYYDAMKEMFESYVLKGVPVDQVRPIPWIENIYPELKAYGERRTGRTFANSTQAWYGVLHQTFPPGLNSPTNLGDNWGFLEREIRDSRLLSPQVSSFGLFTNVSRSSYHSGQFSVRKRFSDGLSMTMNYTLSNSKDITSAAEARGNRPSGGLQYEGQVTDPYRPELSYAYSDFDRRHQFNGNFIAELPFGRGRRIGSQIPGWLNQIIGGWDTSGIVIATSGRPFNFNAGSRFNLHWSGSDQPVLIKALPYELTKQNGRVYLFPGTADDRQALALENFQLTYPGGPIARNQGRGPGFFNVDGALGKSFAISEGVEARFRWEVFNVFNHPNFDIPTTSAGTNIDSRGGTFGEVVQTVGTERTMQFSLRLEF
jgi:hypothetical protein